jgi:molybdate transport system substrate-binding protein
MVKALLLAAVAVSLNLSATVPATAAEIKIISANGMREVINETKANFEAASGHTLNVTVVETGAIRQRVLAGEAFDVIMVPRNVTEEFAKERRLAAGSEVPLIRVNFGLAVRADAPKPDTSTADGLKRTFLDAKSVLITDPATGGISGVHLMEVLGKLGIADAMKGKLVPNRGTGHHAERVVKGEADLAVQAEHEIRCVPGAAFLDYPKEYQRAIVFTGGVGSASADAAAAKAYLAFVTGPVVAPVIKAKCLSPA